MNYRMGWKGSSAGCPILSRTLRKGGRDAAGCPFRSLCNMRQPTVIHMPDNF
jgi:hypothetical protein